ncbi:voltage-dependent calcium channel subunit alpha-2/delta-3-like [Oppia nitens]|uniref:voltage-dependent calcium channel subunit alpha-2/delta-3-like n=1 Tax=Oppia nitens TaxID=1686743 RepID=UPI0023DAD245|nr:voltage-dependent calcium channel subunit alpha-2/delta-3-like [Oppia nitens]
MAAINIWPLIALIITSALVPVLNQSTFITVDPYEVRNLALRFGKDIYEGSSESTCVRKITQNFKDMNAKVIWFDSNKMMEDMRNDVINTLNWKKQAVDRIANESQRLAANHTYDKNVLVEYLNMKRLYNEREGEPPSHHNEDQDVEWKAVKLSLHPNFETSNVNLDLSAVHVPINVYEKAPDILNDIKWSDALTPYFKNNLAFDPGLSWQFFGSSKGFLRLYPATQWKTDVDFLGWETPPPDLYDCRMRPWYIQGAASPKDIVILLDTSGSMTGLRNKIAKNVVSTILDTLTDDDYVAILKFSDNVTFINNCFDNLVLANEKNVRQLKDDVDKVRPTEVANFTSALMKAFDLLQVLNRTKMGCQCNQAIMLITDGAPLTFEVVFKTYNWPNIPVRVFTYLIGREVTDSQEVYWMACHNRGYYTHVANLAEVREQVQQYIPVMSRPIVLSGERIFSWTPVYAHVSEVPLSDWVWEEKEKQIKYKILQQQQQQQNKQEMVSDSQTKEDFEDSDLNNNKDIEEGSTETDGFLPIPTIIDNEDTPINTESEFPKKSTKPKRNLQLMTTLSTPVFDTRNYTNITRKILVKNVYQDSEPETIRIANLLGVAGVDVPIKEIVKLTPAFKLGVNGYSFMITNNGYLLYHPDLRPLYQEMLKPYYSSVDISEVELADTDSRSREMDENINEIRGNMINRTVGWKKVKVKIHLDSMKRVVTRVNHYIYGKIDFTPFSLAIVLPEPYGSYRVEGQIEVKVRREENFTHYFRENNWKVHPDWVYCESPHKMSAILPENAEEAITQFLKTVVNGHNFRWKTSSTRPQVYETISCDKYLTQSLVFDAKATDIDTSKCGTNSYSTKIEDQKLKMFGIVTTFVATRSGLTRFEDHRSKEEKKNNTFERPFFDQFTRATEELYYRRAVDFHAINDSAFVFSVPFDSHQMNRDEVLVTGSHAIFLGTGKSSAPVAVVGLQFKHSVFVERFLNITNKYSKSLCSSDEIDCYLLDNNAFIIYSKEFSHTGKFFGEIDNNILEKLVDKSIYRKVHMYDYQAICFKIITPPSPASILLTPFNHLKSLLLWTWSHILSLYINIWYNSWVISSQSDYDYGSDSDDYNDKSDNQPGNKSLPYPCDKEFDLYEIVSPLSEEPIQGDDNCGQNCGRQYTVQWIPYTNMIMVVIHKTCNCDPISTIKFELKEVVYNVSYSCHLLKTELPRKRPVSCHNYHPQEKEIKQCGKGSHLYPSFIFIYRSDL